MFELEEKSYFYLLLLIPVLALLFAYTLLWKKKKQKEFGATHLIKNLSPEKSIFKPMLKYN